MTELGCRLRGLFTAAASALPARSLVHSKLEDILETNHEEPGGIVVTLFVGVLRPVPL